MTDVFVPRRLTGLESLLSVCAHQQTHTHDRSYGSISRRIAYEAVLILVKRYILKSEYLVHWRR